MDRSAEFRSLCEVGSGASPAASASHSPTETLLRQRLQSPNKDKAAEVVSASGPMDAVRRFLEECRLAHQTVKQLNKEVSRLAGKPSTLSFTVTASDRNSGSTAAMEQALNICTANLAVLKERLQSIHQEVEAVETRRGRGNVLSWFIGDKARDPKDKEGEEALCLPSQSLLEHCRLVLGSLEAMSGLLTEALEAHKQRQRKRAALLHHGPSLTLERSGGREGKVNRNRDKIGDGIVHRNTGDLNTDTHAPSTNLGDSQQALLQMENTHLVEELLGSLASTESQVLEIARLQAALSVHLTAQFHLTARIFEESVQADEDTRKGNVHLRRAGSDSAFGRRAFVVVVCGLALVLLLLHYFRK